MTDLPKCAFCDKPAAWELTGGRRKQPVPCCKACVCRSAWNYPRGELPNRAIETGRTQSALRTEGWWHGGE